MIESDDKLNEQLFNYFKDSDDKEFIKEPVLADDGEEAAEGFCKHCGAKLDANKNKEYCDEAVKEKTATNLYHGGLRLVGLSSKEVQSGFRNINMLAYKALCYYMYKNGVHESVIGEITGGRSRSNTLTHIKSFKNMCEIGNIEALKYRKMVE